MVKTANLAFELAYRPVAPDALDFVKRALQVVIEINNQFQVTV